MPKKKPVRPRAGRDLATGEKRREGGQKKPKRTRVSTPHSKDEKRGGKPRKDERHLIAVVKPDEVLENGQWETFCQKMALGVFSNYSCYMQAYPETTTPEAARRSASDLLTKTDIQARIAWIRQDALKNVKHSIEESVLWCKRVIGTPVGYIDDESPLAQEVERTIQGTEAEGVITKVKVKTPSKMDAQKHLDDLLGFKKIDKDANKTADAIVDLVSWIRNGANMVPKGGTGA